LIQTLTIEASDDILIVGGGDGMWAQTAIGLEQGYAANYECCPYCLIRGDNKSSKVPHVERTLAMAYRCAHVFQKYDDDGVPVPFQCDACETTFTTQEEIDATMPTSENRKKVYRSTHYGWSFGRRPCLDIEPMKSFCCTLHLKLCIGKLLYKFIVSVHVTKWNLGTVLPILNRLNISETGERPTTDAIISVKTVHLNGSEVDAFIQNVDEIMNALEMPDVSKEQARTSVDLFCCVYNTLTDPANTTAVTRAQRVRDEAMLLFDHLYAWQQDDGINYYVHHIIKHVPDQILMLPDNFPFHVTSGSGLEAQNYMTKRLARNHCNNHKYKGDGGPKPRTTQILERVVSETAIEAATGIPISESVLRIQRIQTSKHRYGRKAKSLKPLLRKPHQP
jgi:hypothetical protein